MTTALWLSKEFSVHSKDANWSNVGGVYVFAGVNAQNQWRAIYIGQAASFAERIPSHERWTEAARAGATHVHARTVPSASDRDALEQSLISTYKPSLNTQYV